MFKYEINKYKYQIWYRNDKRHRFDGPAVVCDGARTWYKNGKTHRIDGPAIVYVSGVQKWYQNNKFIKRVVGM